jgi:drug/metabolite transporter (DMT)-like permease
LGIIFVFNPLNIENNSTSTLLALASGFTWACGAILSKRIHFKFPKIDLLIMTAWQMLWGSIPLLVIALLIKSEPIIWSYSFLSILCFNAYFCKCNSVFIMVLCIKAAPSINGFYVGATNSNIWCNISLFFVG